MKKVDNGGVGLLFGSYIPVLEDLARKSGLTDLADPAKVLDGGIYPQYTVDIATGYLNAGANVAVTNTYPLRQYLRRGDERTFIDAVSVQGQLLFAALQGRNYKDFLFSCGSYGHAYKADEAPSPAEAKDFHLAQLAVVAAVSKLLGIETVALFEAICTSREALGIALAAKEISRHTSLPVILSLLVDNDAKLYDGSDLNDVLREVDDATDKVLRGFSVNCCPPKAIPRVFNNLNGNRERLLLAYPNAADEDPRALEGGDEIVHLHDPDTTIKELVRVARENPHLLAIGGCCGFETCNVRDIHLALKAEE